MSELIYLSATEARALFAKRALSPVELLEALIERTEQVEPKVNAFTERLFDEALAAAAQAEARYLGKGPAPRPLEGIPVAAKEKHAIAGRSLTEGSLISEGGVAAENAPVIDRVLDAGGIIHARTTTPEFSISPFTHTPMWGITRNPWNPDYTPGGSSGGSAAALAAGTALLATASDIGGSTRIPAAFTGIVGFKAPYGRIPGTPPLSMDFYRGDGPLARTVDDTILFANTLIGPDPRDHTSLRPRIALPTEYEPAAGMRVALCVRLGDYDVKPDVERNTRAAADALAQAGVVVEEIELPWTRAEIGRATGKHFGTIFGALVQDVVGDRRDLVAPYTAAFLGWAAKAADRGGFLEGLRIETRMQRELAEAMSGFDALLCPTAAIPALPAGDDLIGEFEVDGHRFARFSDATLTTPFNINNRCPVLAVPSGHGDNGVPTGVQIVGHTYDDATVFRLGKELERVRPWAYTESHRPAL
ncbi:amidase [Saccharopolyspora elongata]|uniref:Amidase n=1 Tax=Saccharopolyspora elongata TaxID=2530387 RepID=A0A4R4Z3T5_9PSEU|nr:amidase [Saccharopolyspora elongata]TDD52496.1 amidase [Saccharopolyspora elongata]